MNKLTQKNAELGRFLFCERYTLQPVKNSLFIAEGQDLKRGAVVDVNGVLVGTNSLMPYAVLENDCDTRAKGAFASVFVKGEFNIDKLFFADGLSKEDLDNIVYNGSGLGIVIKPYEYAEDFSPLMAPSKSNPLMTESETERMINDAVSEVTLDPSAVAFGNVHLLDEVTEFPADGCILIDSETNGPEKMSKDTLLELTAQNALVDNFASNLFTSYNIGELNDTNITVDGKYVDKNGYLQDAEPYAVYSDLTIHPNETICILAEGYQDNVSVLSKFSDDLYTPLVKSVTSVPYGYSYTNESYADVPVRVCSRKSTMPVHYIRGYSKCKDQNYQEGLDLLASSIYSNFQVHDFPAVAEDGKYVAGSNGNVSTSSSYVISSSITLASGDTVVLECQGNASNIAIISLYDGESYTPLVKSDGDDTKCYSYTNKTTSTQTLRFSYRKSYIPKTYITGKSELNYINTLLKIALNEIMSDFAVNDMPAVGEANKYVVAASGAVSSFTGFNISSTINLAAGATIAYYAKGSGTNIAMISLYDGVSYTPVCKSVDSTMRVYSYTNNSNATQAVRFSYDARENNAPLFYVVGKLNYMDVSNEELPELSMFETLGIIGDSYDSGELYLPDGTLIGDVYKKSWGQIAGRKNGIAVTNYSKGGLSTKTWLTNATRGLAAMNADNPLDCYVIRLVKNDVGYFGIEWLGTIADIHVGQPELNAESFYGCYGKIIEAVKAHAPEAKIILSQNDFNDSEAKQAYNSAIADIAELYELPMIVPYADSFFSSPVFTERYSNHPTYIGYAGMADALVRLLRKAILGYKDYFKVYTETPIS